MLFSAALETSLLHEEAVAFIKTYMKSEKESHSPNTISFSKFQIFLPKEQQESL